MSANGLALDVPGIFKARPFDWSVQPSKETKSVAVCVGLLIDEQYDPETKSWVSWKEGDEVFHTRGWWYVIGKEGKVNTAAIEQLVKSLGWDGSLTSIKGDPPDVVVQVTVKEDEYKGEKRLKAQWMNPEDYVPEFSGASEADVNKLQTQFGSLLRAAAAVAKKTAKPAAKKPEPAAVGKSVGVKTDAATGQPADDGDVPLSPAEKAFNENLPI